MVKRIYARVPLRGWGIVGQKERTPMRTTRLLAFLVSAACALACAGTHPAPRFAWDRTADLSSAKTFGWYVDSSSRLPHGDSIVDGRFIDSHTREAIERELEEKGLRRVETGSPEIYVAYHTGQDGVAAQDEYGVYDWWSFPVAVYEGTDYEKERSLTIDLRDGGKKLVWRGSITRPEGRNPGAVAREIDRSVRELLQRFPPVAGRAAAS